MKALRIHLFLPLVFALLFAQQAGAAHALSHALDQASQQEKHAPNSPCEKCANYAQFGTALGICPIDLAPPLFHDEEECASSVLFQSRLAPSGVARGPPSFLPLYA